MFAGLLLGEKRGCRCSYYTFFFLLLFIKIEYTSNGVVDKCCFIELRFRSRCKIPLKKNQSRSGKEKKEEKKKEKKKILKTKIEKMLRS